MKAKAALLAWLLTAGCFAQIVYVRHGETLANSTGRYNSRTIDNFSPKGKHEIISLNLMLQQMGRFQGIVVSPAPRTLKTIAPYLQATHQRALVWPLLYECCTGRRPKNAHPTKFSYGSRIVLPKALSSYFVLSPEESRFPVANDYNAGLAQVKAAVMEFKRRFSGRRLLIVGHSGMGGQFLHALTGHWIKVENAHPYSFSTSLLK